ncbi:MAG: ATP-binding protein, partial [Nitrospirae bacterium]|nr:ATP-binding protein [Nitrospirota bacterium]
INVKSAGLLTESFYKNISEGFTIADALRLARIDLEENGLLPWDFGIPILFTTHCDLEKGELPVSEGKAKVKTRGGRLLEAKEERFAGRRRELIKIAKVFNGDGYFRGVMIHGAGGMGKTALALEAAHRFGEDFDEIVFASARKDAPSSELSKANPKGAGVSRLSGSVHDFLSQIMSELRSLHKEVNLPEGADFLNICNAISETIGNCGNSLVILDNLEDILRDFEISNDTDDKPVDVDPKFIEFINSLTKEKCKIVLTSRYDFTNLPVGEFKRIALKPLEGRELSDFFIELFDSKQTKPNYEAINAILSKTGGHPFT